MKGLTETDYRILRHWHHCCWCSSHVYWSSDVESNHKGRKAIGLRFQWL